MKKDRITKIAIGWSTIFLVTGKILSFVRETVQIRKVYETSKILAGVTKIRIMKIFRMNHE